MSSGNNQPLLTRRCAIWHDLSMPTRSRSIGALTERAASLLRQRIADLNWSDGQVADAAGIARGTFSRLLNAKKPIYLEQLDATCAVLGLDLGWVLDEADRQSRGRARVIGGAFAPGDFDLA